MNNSTRRLAFRVFVIMNLERIGKIAGVREGGGGGAGQKAVRVQGGGRMQLLGLLINEQISKLSSKDINHFLEVRLHKRFEESMLIQILIAFER